MVIEPKTAAAAAAHFDNSNSNSGDRDGEWEGERTREGEDGRLTIENGRDKKNKARQKTSFYRTL